jgi:hypothetical protein
MDRFIPVSIDRIYLQEIFILTALKKYSKIFVASGIKLKNFLATRKGAFL